MEVGLIIILYFFILFLFICLSCPVALSLFIVIIGDGYLLYRYHPPVVHIDLLVEDLLIIELKSVEAIKNVHLKQLLTYLKLTGKPVGLLVNFNSVEIDKNIKRLVNGKIDDL